MASKCVINAAEATSKLVVCFGGMSNQFYGIPPFEFLTFLSNHFGDWDKQFYIDIKGAHYHHGIDGISRDIDETVTYLRDTISAYKHVVFMGTSAGGYAAILFGSLLDVTAVVAFMPQTKIEGRNKYGDLKPYINQTTHYHIYGDISCTTPYDMHHISHCENIEGSDNVHIYRKNGISMKKMRDSGELFQILSITLT